MILDILYYFGIKILTSFFIDTTSKIIFEFIPESTYIGLNAEILEVTFLQRDKIISVANNTKSLSNHQTSHKIRFRSDAITEEADEFSTVIGYIAAFGFFSTIFFEQLSKFLFGFYSNTAGILFKRY